MQRRSTQLRLSRRRATTNGARSRYRLTIRPTSTAGSIVSNLTIPLATMAFGMVFLL